MPAAVCLLCQAAGSAQCPDCPAHQARPAPVRVESRPGRGRCLVTTRDCQPGELLLLDTPVLTAPHTRSRPQCLACARLAPPARCPRCGIVM